MTKLTRVGTAAVDYTSPSTAQDAALRSYEWGDWDDEIV